MIPKLFIRLREFAFFGHLPDGKERASGYTHNYYDNRDIDLNALSTFPSDQEIQDSAAVVYQEAENLWFLLGHSAAVNPVPLAVQHITKLPSMSSWFQADNHTHTLVVIRRSHAEFEDSVQTFATLDDANTVDLDYESDIGEDYKSESVSESAQIQLTINRAEKMNLDMKAEDRVNRLVFAAVALSSTIPFKCEFKLNL
jgi:hypothetical protein